MAAVRKAGLRYFLQDPIRNRIEKKIGFVSQLIQSMSGKDCAIITHGFFMRFLYLTQKEGRTMDEIDYEMLANAPNFGFLQGFEI